jgi:hypothetical protein
MNGTRRVHLPWLIASRGLFLSLTFLAAPAVLAQDAPAPTPEPETPKIDVTGFDSDGGFMTIEYRGDFTQEPYFTFSGKI